MSWYWTEVPKPEDIGECLNPGHLACQGCGATISMRLALKALGPKTMMAIPACCWTIIDGAWPNHALKVPLMHTAFETAAIAASGIRAALDIKGKSDIQVVAWAGDGGTFDIGIQALSGAAERNENIIYVCYDNEAYMNTGIQRSSATPWGAWTTTTPEKHPEAHPKKNMVQIMAAHKIPYTASASIAFPNDFVRKFKKASQIKGTRFMHIFSPCPPGWKMASDLTIKVARLAVETKIFPLIEIEDGDKVTINYWPTGLPAIEYLKLQGRFKHLTQDQVDYIQAFVDKEWERLVKLHKETHGELPKEAKENLHRV